MMMQNNEEKYKGWTNDVEYAFEWTEGFLIQNGSGKIITNTDYSITDYKPCNGASRIDIEWTDYCSCGFYDENKNTISTAYTNPNVSSIAVPAGAQYIMFCSRTAVKENQHATPYE